MLGPCEFQQRYHASGLFRATLVGYEILVAIPAPSHLLRCLCLVKAGVPRASNKLLDSPAKAPFTGFWSIHRKQSIVIFNLSWCLTLQDNTMLVQGQRSFSHEEFRGVVYSKYIQSPETMVRLHIQMARYFARLPASDRKVQFRLDSPISVT